MCFLIKFVTKLYFYMELTKIIEIICTLFTLMITCYKTKVQCHKQDTDINRINLQNSFISKDFGDVTHHTFGENHISYYFCFCFCF